MPDVTVPDPPILATVSNVELAQTGTWMLSSGPATFTRDDFVSAVAALDCPAVHNPVVKIGHVDPRFDGEPAVGWIGNMAAADDGRTLVGDYKGVPSWLAEILPAAWPQRSIEGQFDFRCQMGHTHPFVVTAVALLGVTHPGVGSIASLQDVADLYGVTVAASEPDPTGVPVTVVASERTAMPNPRPLQVAAAVTSDDVRRAFYESPIGSDWDAWIEEIQLDPLQIIYIDDDEGARYRVPVTIAAGDGPDAVTFGEPVRVVVRYEDSPATVAAAGAPAVVRFASRAESRPGDRPAQTPAATSASGSTTEPTQEVSMSFTDEQLAQLRTSLGIADENADGTTILAAINEALAERADPPPAPSTPPIPDGHVLVDQSQLEQLQVAASAGQEARAEQLQAHRVQLVSAAIRDGRVAPARRDHWLSQLAADPGAEQVLASLAPVFPTTPAGYAAAEDAEDGEFDHLFPPTAAQEG